MLIFIIAFCTASYFCYNFYVKNQNLTLEIQQNLALYEENLSEKTVLEQEIQSLNQQINQATQENVSLQEIVDNTLPRLDLYDGSTSLFSSLYSDMCVDKVDFSEPLENTVYLTFDDGPSQITLDILDTLALYDIKATFFVQGVYLNSEQNAQILKRAYDEGHAIGVHTDTHIYTDVYSSMPNFLKDYYAVWDKIYAITGERTALYRFPGGSVNGYNKKIIDDIKIDLENRGFVYYDWNVSSDDAITGATVDSIISNATTINGYSRAIILMHDSGTKAKTAEALSEIIEFYLNQGYSFDKLTADVKPIQF